MGIHLNSSGGLTESQRIQADSLGMPHEEFKQKLIERLVEIRGGKTPKTKRTMNMKKNVITAKNPVLVVASGPSYLKNIENIRKFTGKLVVADVNFNSIVKNGIIPDYVVTLESSKRIINPNIYEVECLKKCVDKTVLVGSSITTSEIENHVKDNGIEFQRWLFPEEARCSNVGNFAMNYSYNVLKADKIMILGFEHNGTKYPVDTYLTWQTDFWYFIRKWPKETIINCSDGGVLYYEDYIIDTTLGDLKLTKY